MNTHTTAPHYNVGETLVCNDNTDAPELKVGGKYRVVGLRYVTTTEAHVHLKPLGPDCPHLESRWSYRPERFARASGVPHGRRCLLCGGSLYWGGKGLWHSEGLAGIGQRVGPEDALWHLGRREDAALCSANGSAREVEIKGTLSAVPDDAAPVPATITIPAAEYERLLADADRWRRVAQLLSDISAE